MMSTDSELSVASAVEAGQLLLDLRATFGDLDPADTDTANRLRKEADRASHLLIVDRLGSARPNDCILSEEGKDDLARLSADRVWIVDPLDGTFEYGQGRSDFAVHIVLWVRDESAPTGGRLEASTVELPAQKLTRTDTAPADLSFALPTDRPIRIGASRSRAPKWLPAAVVTLAERLGREVEVIDVGSVGAKVNEILCGRADAYVHDTGFYEWDVAAPYAVAHRYGLHASHVDGAPIVFNADPPYVTSLLVAIPPLLSDLRVVFAEASSS